MTSPSKPRRSVLLALAAAAAVPASGCKDPPPPPAPVPAPETASATDVTLPPTHDGTRELDAKLINYFRLIERNQPGDTGTARVRLRNHLKEHAKDGQAMFLFGLSYHREKRYGKARELFEQAIGHAPDFPTTYYFYGWCLYYLGEPEASREMFESFLAVKPGYPDALFALGLIDYDADRIDSARARFTEAIRLAAEKQDRSTESKSRARLADVLVRLGELDEARRELLRSIDLNPDNYETYFKLSRVLDRLGDAEGAAEARRKHDEVRERIRPGSDSRPEEIP